jgi:hypothetical protein
MKTDSTSEVFNVLTTASRKDLVYVSITSFVEHQLVAESRRLSEKKSRKQDRDRLVA